MTRSRVFVTRRIADVALQRLGASVEVDLREHPSAPHRRPPHVVNPEVL